MTTPIAPDVLMSRPPSMYTLFERLPQEGGGEEKVQRKIQNGSFSSYRSRGRRGRKKKGGKRCPDCPLHLFSSFCPTLRLGLGEGGEERLLVRS